MSPRRKRTTKPNLLSLIVVSYNNRPTLQRCLASVIQRSDVSTEVIVVDNASSDGGAVDAQREFPEIQLISNTHNVGFAAAANQGLAKARGEWIGLLNPDVEIPKDALGALIDVARSAPIVAAVGPALQLPDGTPQPFSYGDDPSPGYLFRRGLARAGGKHLHEWDGDTPRPVDWISGACLIARRTAWAQVGLLDERFFLYFEDNDWCRRCRQSGWEVWFVPTVSVIHQSQPSYADTTRVQHYQNSLLAFYRKHYGLLAAGGMKIALLYAKRKAAPGAH